MSTGLGGGYRKQIYEHIETIIGRVLTKEEHRALRYQLKMYVAQRTENYTTEITRLSVENDRLKKPHKKKRYGKRK